MLIYLLCPFFLFQLKLSGETYKEPAKVTVFLIHSFKVSLTFIKDIVLTKYIISHPFLHQDSLKGFGLSYLPFSPNQSSLSYEADGKDQSG